MPPMPPFSRSSIGALLIWYCTASAHKQIEYRAMLVFQRLIRSYDSFLLVSALMAVGALTFDEFHPSTNAIDRAAEGFFTSATCSAVVAVMLAVMLSFRFEGHVSATRLGYVIAWSPLVLLDWSIIGVLLGMSTWYWQKNASWRAGMLVGSVAILLCFSIWVAFMVWQKMGDKGGLGEEGSKAFREVKQGSRDDQAKTTSPNTVLSPVMIHVASEA
ncbi:uncharacterized protein RAG0_12525 [Rhynchosporium agropyri]|uniref:Uncharacterized protein n=1 Tax=Rhynchosporium agropyri TaxID=914238 RepID=A0A1E1LB93_9HELO|nr:uncharacterized protein RAG0_12525 [Rhynchosporium agropyri]